MTFNELKAIFISDDLDPDAEMNFAHQADMGCEGITLDLTIDDVSENEDGSVYLYLAER